jgi:hypothetical protein
VSSWLFIGIIQRCTVTRILKKDETCTLEDIFKMDLKQGGQKGVHWMNLSLVGHDGGLLRHINATSGFTKCGKFLEWIRKYQLL